MFPPFEQVEKKVTLVTVEGVYGTANPDTPKDWKAVAFRDLKATDHAWLTPYGTIATNPATEPERVRIILEPFTPKRHVFEETGEFRKANGGEWAMDSYGVVFPTSSPTFGEVTILRKIEE